MHANLCVNALTIKENYMNWDQIKGNWKQYTGKLQEKWGLLTDDDIAAIAGKRTRLAGKLQERYGLAKADAHKELDAFTKTLSK
jgi:uncharacterized protein YjbJ (UPF0337 family)